MSKFDPQKFLIDRFLSLGFLEANDKFNKWGFIRQAYMEYLPEIMELGKSDPARWVNPYVLDWDIHLNEAEKLAWHSIRCRRVVLYPQFPAYNFFLDFGNPYLRIALEVDGKQHDMEKDTQRDSLLASIGWKVFRVTGREVYTDANSIIEQPGFDLFDPEQRDSVLTWLFTTADGVIQAMEWVYFTDDSQWEDEPEWRSVVTLAEESLRRHRLAAFPIRESNFTQPEAKR